ncbi:MAG: helix-turn-helix transcriptional regulator [Gemmatimonadales bacterium]|nr:helix-turn-helix transcriptional regulator [Gemmatimonadales bacterium]
MLRTTSFSRWLYSHSLSARMVADRLGLSVATVHSWMNGARRPHKIIHAQIAQAIGATPARVQAMFRTRRQR